MNFFRWRRSCSFHFTRFGTASATIASPAIPVPVAIPVAVAMPATAFTALTAFPSATTTAAFDARGRAFFRATCDLVVILAMFLEKVGHVKEGVPLEAQVHEGGLHARQNPSHSPLVDAPGQGVFIRALEVNFYQLILFENRHPRFVAIGGNHQFFAHSTLLP